MINDIMIVFAWMSIALLAGAFLRYRIPFLKKFLVPSSVIGGVVGYFLVNAGVAKVSSDLLAAIAFQIFIISFISVGLTGTEKQKGITKTLGQGAVWMATLWIMLMSLQLVVGGGVAMATNFFGSTMDPFYGFMLPFGFAMGPGQAVTYGTIFQNMGWDNITMVGLTFAAIGFLFAFLVGVPVARMGIRKGLAKQAGEISPDVLNGIYPVDKQKESAGPVSFHGSNMDTLSFHIALVLGVYLITFFIAGYLASFLPPLGGQILMGLLYVWGLLVAYCVKYIMTKFKFAFMHSNDIQRRITGLAIDYLVICTFMAVQFALIVEWIIPIILICIAGVILTGGVTFYLGQRIGSEIDFERSLAVFGMSTGTVPSGLALLRIVDPNFKTTAPIELGLNMPIQMISILLLGVIIGAGSGAISLERAMLIYTAVVFVCLIVLKIFKIWGPKTYKLFDTNSTKIQG